MALSSFAIQFRYMVQLQDVKGLRQRNHVYQANITTLSNAFKLFEVTGIRRITKKRSIRLPGAYYLTSYPLYNAGKDTWKDAVTANADEFLQAIGDAIENYLTVSDKEFYSCLN